jgi:hypothetical protein
MGDSASPPSAARRAYLALRNRLRRDRLRRDGAWWLLALLTVVGLAAIIASAWLAHLTPHKDKWLNALWLEVAKAGVQVVAVGVLGGALAAIWQQIRARRDRRIARKEKVRDRRIARKEKIRDREIERNDKIRAELVSLVALYNDVKAVRRILRSLGLDLKTYPGHEQEQMRQDAVLTEEQARGFHAQMLILSGLQLGFEAKVKQFGQTNFLGDDTGKVVEALGRIERHLNQVLDLWEQHGWTIREGTALAVVYGGLEKLFRVTDYFRPQVSDQMRKITKLINEHVFGGATTATEDVVARLDQKRHEQEDAQETSSGDPRV